MSDSTALPLETVNGLVEERERFVGWLAQLDERRASTPEHVYSRVRGDYEMRLQGVLDRLAGHATELQAAIDNLGARVETLRAEERQREDERCEAELRAVVGEYSAEQWDEIRDGVDATLARLAGERSGAEAELARLEQVMALAVPQSVAEAPEPEPEAAPAAVPPAPLDELEFLKSVIAPTGSYPAVPADAPPPPDVPGLQGTGQAPLFNASEMAEAARDLGRRAASGLSAGLREGGTEPIKTLKCQECSTMNYPTEWYCERCGGELAAL